MKKILEFKNKILEFIYKYRFIIALLVLIIGVLLKLHGSSIGLWNTIFNTGITSDTSLLHGTLRTIRSDEWAVTTPLILSQNFNGFKYFSDILRGGILTDAFSLYGLPVFGIMSIFRPFHLGYLFLGIERGLSFFWIAKYICLFMVSFEFFQIFSNKNKRLSIIGSFMITFAPMVQWWFSTNGTPELFIYGELAIILLYNYLNTTNFKHRILYLIFAIICAGGYILVLYPAFQIPLFYVFLILAIYVIIDNRKNCKISKKDIFSIIIALLVFVLLMGYIFYNSADTLKIVSQTVYPGNRHSDGGGALEKFISYTDNVFISYKTEYLPTHQCEEAVMFGLFPLGIILSLINMIKSKKKDLFTILLFIPYIILGLFSFVKIPILAKLTFLNYSIGSRSIIALGFIDILFLLRSLAIEEKSIKWWKSAILSIILSGILIIIVRTLHSLYVGWILATFLFGLMLLLFFGALEYNTKYGKYLFTYAIIITMIAIGANVNPISSGLNMIYDSPMIQAMENINNEEKGVWLAEALPFPCPNYPEMAGCAVINATNIYPNMDLWKQLDPEGKYNEVYNRYAHVYMELVATKEMISDKFVLQDTDKITVYVTPEELKTLNIKYIFTVRVMEDFENDKLDVDLIYNENNYHIYKVNYLGE